MTDTLPRHRWEDMASRDFRTLTPATVAVLPVGAIEQHGPHLPVCVDSCINAGLLSLALDRAPPTLPVTALPIQTVGKSDEHIAYPGTLTLSAATLTAILLELGASVHRAGIRRLILLNSHGGQPQILEIVARELRRTHQMFVVTTAWWAFGTPEGMFTPEERRFGIHGGDAETSMMLFLRPDLVHMDRAAHFRPWSQDMTEQFRWLEPEGRIGFGWHAQDLHPAGAAGNAANATAEKGRQIADKLVAGFLELVDEVSRYPLDRLRPASADLG
ncbi:creatininase family protein [Gluconacetobacter tumulicola]|uniref:Creatininase family protein n=1 Tax=Gluconacetobacter tumulicola TaxID=1017177 RepID=A0A7W4JEQ9_9PROT|nr:creatininase family protein [Gluconacetobacter tumulicola]MBB2179889.1 creatininase family protein [Gluconacetobacter tumulicola]